MYVRRFERHQLKSDNRLSVREIRNTVRSAEWESSAEIAEWLGRACERQSADLYRAVAMARKAVQGQSTRGETYLVLAELGFLAGITEEEEAALVAQAVRLRPHNAGILFVQGMTYVEDGDLDTAMDLWRTAFEKDPAIRPMIIRGLVPYLSAEEIIRQFEPEHDGLYQMYVAYLPREQPENLDTIMARHIVGFDEYAATDTEPPPHYWQQSFQMFKTAEDTSRAIFALRKAVSRNIQNYDLRKQLGLLLLENGEKQEAMKELNWCLFRMPDDREIAEALGIEQEPWPTGDEL